MSACRGSRDGPVRVPRRFAVLMLVLAWSWLLGLLGPSRAHASPSGVGFAARYLVGADVPDDLFGQPIAEIRFEGNRRVESEAMMLEIDSAVGELLTRKKLAADIRRLWGLGYFEDIRVEGELGPNGVVLTYVVRERPTVRKIIVEGNTKVKLDDINEVLDLEKNQVLDLGKVKANVEKIRDLYTEEGFFLAKVDYALRPVPDNPGQVDVVIVIEESKPVVVRSITFVGNKAFSDRQLQRTIQTRVGGYLSILTKKAGGVFNRDAFAQDFQFLKSWYFDHGYLDVRIKDPQISLSADRRFVHITIPVEEGPQYRIGEIRAKEVVPKGESPLYTEQALAESITPLLRKGDVAAMGKVERIRSDIERRYKDAGYAYVNVVPNARPDKENLLLYLTLEVDKGPLVYIERIEISGNEKTADKVIRRELLVSEGDLYSETGKERSEFAVLRLGYFSEATVSTSKGSAPDKIVLNVEVTERLTGTFQVGAGFSTIENFVLQAQIAYDNFLGRGATVQLVAQLSSLRRNFNLSFFTRYFLDSRWNFIFSVFNARTINPSFARDSTGFRVSWGYPLPFLRNLTVFLGYNLEYVKTGVGNFGTVGGIFSPGSLVSISPSRLVSNLLTNGLTSAVETRVAYDTRDNFLYPTQGQFHQLRASFASRYFGSQNEFNKYDLDSRLYFPVIRSQQAFRAWLVFKTRLQIGFVHSPTAQGVPIFERYFPGGIFGAGGIRGYRLASLGPMIKVQSGPDPTSPAQGFRVGGNLLTAFNAEFEFMIVPPANIKGVLFYDMGNAFNTEPQYCFEPEPELPKSDPCDRFRLRNLRYSVGFGVRWQSPIGPLRFEWGFPLDRQRATPLNPRGEDPVVFEFNIGNSF
ncbi:MAG: outer membrane protein assembly factor BamA [Deltaproteobacteria bacterium]|nr:MAG: outer membrane protein assembly factor BamA [Deltaproteobacteria bacterium]